MLNVKRIINFGAMALLAVALFITPSVASAQCDQYTANPVTVAVTSANTLGNAHFAFVTVTPSNAPYKIYWQNSATGQSGSMLVGNGSGSWTTAITLVTGTNRISVWAEDGWGFCGITSNTVRYSVDY